MSTHANNSILPVSYYEASLLDASLLDANNFNQRAHYAALNHEVDCDVCVVGGGFMGLHTALNLQEQGLKVVVLEAKVIGFGASGRNGGHVIPEFGGSQRSFEQQLGMQSAMAIWQLAHQAADQLRERISHYQIACDYQAGHIEAAISNQHLAALKHWQAHINQNYGDQSQMISLAEMPQYIGSNRYQAGLLNMNGGHLHPLKLACGLARALSNSNSKNSTAENSDAHTNEQVIYENSAAISWTSNKDGSQVLVQTAKGQVCCHHLVLGCNVGIKSIQNKAAQKLAQRILPVASWVIATEPLAQSLANELLPSRAAVVDMRFILDYYRLSADNRLIFGGGCSYTGQQNPASLKKIMRDKMLKVFPQLQSTPIEFGWGGLIDISMNRMPDINYVASSNQRVLYAQGFSGSGIVATVAAARAIADAITGHTEKIALFQRIQHTRFIGGKWLRGPITAAGMLYHRLLDNL